MTTAFIHVDHVTKTHGTSRTAVRALDGLNLTIPAGVFWSIMGPSGSGKSTLLHLIGLLDRPTAGTITIHGTKITPGTNLSQLAQTRRQLIGFIFQQFFLLPRLSILENVALPALYAGQPRARAEERSHELLKKVGLANRANHRPTELSGGEQQRAAIARALVNDPFLLLADEPTGNLDSSNGMAILELIESVHQEGKTILLVTHDLEIGQRAEKIVRLKDGRLVS